MINPFGYYASAKGMVLVPNLSGLSSSAAIAALSASGLEYSLGTDVNTGTSSLDNLVAEQSPVADTLVDYSTVVAFRLYNYVSSPPPAPPTTYYGTACCNNYVTVQASSTSQSTVENSLYLQCLDEGSSIRSSSISTSGFPSVSCTAPPAPPPPPPPPPPNCTTPKPYPECVCLGGSWAC
jgi:beta-lactam-binding protein with PASTA domain